jgi:cytochrome c peroxidase
MSTGIRPGILRLACRRDATVIGSVLMGVAAFAAFGGASASAQEAVPVAPAPDPAEPPDPVEPPDAVEPPDVPAADVPVPEVDVEPAPGTIDLSKVPDALHAARVPKVPNLERYVQDPALAVALGKALFWDASVGSDGVACASCHFHAGADDRLKNQVNPGLARQDDVASAEAFSPAASGARRTGANYTLTASDFPFHQLSNPADRSSAVVYSTDDVVSSQGTFAGQFIAPIKKGRRAKDICTKSASSIFNVAGVGTRKVEPRNTPTVINAVFNYRNFWDGRASNVFNGKNPFGLRDQTPAILKLSSSGKVVTEAVALENSSLASQAAGPPLSDFEMSCEGRTFADVGRRILAATPLARQKVAADDSVLAALRGSKTGLKGTYTELVKRAFKSEYWAAKGKFKGFTQMETNFSLFWGLAIQAYEATLVSDAAPFDAWVAAGKPLTSSLPGFGEQERLGLSLFVGKGRCINCHSGPEFTAAASSLFDDQEKGALVERMLMGDDKVALYDNGFYNIGVTASSWDIGVGGVDPILQKPLSFTEQYQQELLGFGAPDDFEVNPCTFASPAHEDCNVPPTPPFRTAVRGAFKVPSLRNVELTGPYMHNGGMATLDQVLAFYDRGGNFQNPELDPDISPIGFTPEEKSAVIAFLKSLTDDRVRYERAPFDHPELVVTNGQAGDAAKVKVGSRASLGLDATLTIPPVGRNGSVTPLAPFTPVH